MLGDLIGDVTTIDDVLATMRAIDRRLPDGDGVKWFNFLYLEVTQEVAAERAAWQDWPFLQQFDVVFARLYLDAIVSWERQPAATAHAWRPLFRARHDRKLARIQFALAGMNAHINHDLPVALGRLAEPDGRYPSRDGARYSDFSRVNDILERVEGSVLTVLATGLLGEIEQALGDLDNVLAMWKVRKAREAAWTNGEVLWHLRSTPPLRREFLARLDSMTGFASRGLLLPTLGVAAGRGGGAGGGIRQ
jgi:Family of unknown function (DUF5995)